MQLFPGRLHPYNLPMIRTFIYALGVLALLQTDPRHASAFYSLFLPLVDFLFIVFLSWELLFYFSINGFYASDYNVYDLGRDILDLRHDIREAGFIPAIMALMLSLLDMVLLFYSRVL